MLRRSHGSLCGGGCGQTTPVGCHATRRKQGKAAASMSFGSIESDAAGPMDRRASAAEQEFAVPRNRRGSPTVSLNALGRMLCRERGSRRRNAEKTIRVERRNRNDIPITASSRTKRRRSSRRINVGLKPCTRPITADDAAAAFVPLYRRAFNSGTKECLATELVALSERKQTRGAAPRPATFLPSPRKRARRFRRRRRSDDKRSGLRR